MFRLFAPIGRSTLMFLAGLVALGTVTASPAWSASPDQIDATIKKGVAFVYAQQHPTGQWEDDLTRKTTAHDWPSKQGDTFGGYTALAVFALLEAGEKQSDPRLVKAIDFLKKADAFGTYSVGLRCMVYSRLNQTPEIKRLLQNDVNRLLGGLIREGPGLGMWDYESGLPKHPPTGAVDRSVSQFGVLGLWAGVQAGATVPPETWRLFDTVWRNGQNGDGSWSYDRPASPKDGSVSMTAAGAATLLIVQDVLGSLAGSGGITAPGGSDECINRALIYLSDHYEDVLSSGAYSLYGIERISTAGGFRYLGRVDWFKLASDYLVVNQREEGGWTGGSPGATELTETSLALLTLSHGRAPVLISKLNYSAVLQGVARDAPWHGRPRDAGNLTRFIGAQLEQTFGWQIVNFAATPEEMLESPVLLVTGSKELVLSEKERFKLKSYMDSGGLILFSSEAPPKDGVVGSDAFSKSVVMLAKQIYPDRAFRDLPPNHPLYTDQQYRATRWTNKPQVWGVSNGVRELMILLPEADLGRAWNTNRPTVDAMKWELGSDLCQYATSRMPRPARGHTHVISPSYWMTPTTRPVSADGRAPSAPTTQPVATPDSRPTDYGKVVLPADSKFLAVGRLMIGENWDPEPAAWVRMTALLANNFHLFVDYRPVEASDKDLATVKLLHWTGTTAVKLTPAQRTALLNFITKGGTLLIDASGGSSVFADSVQTELNTLFSASSKEFGAILTADDPVYRLRDARIDKVTYRRYMAGRATGALDAPRVRGLDRGGRTVVYFSREDLTAGCVGQSTDGIMGYSPASATEIMRNIVLTVARRK